MLKLDAVPCKGQFKWERLKLDNQFWIKYIYISQKIQSSSLNIDIKIHIIVSTPEKKKKE